MKDQQTILHLKWSLFPLKCINVPEYDYNSKMFELQETAGNFLRSISSKVYKLSVYQTSQCTHTDTPFVGYYWVFYNTFERG